MKLVLQAVKNKKYKKLNKQKNSKKHMTLMNNYLKTEINKQLKIQLD